MQTLARVAADMLMRIRTTKPAFFKHRGLYELERDTGLPIRVAYQALWGACDRAGRFEWKPDALKLDCIPYDPASMRDVLLALARELYVVQYIVGGRGYGWCPTMPVHQAINARESASLLPPPPRNVVAWYQSAMLAQNMGQPFAEPNPLSEQPVPYLQPGSQNGTHELPHHSRNGAGSVSGSNGNGLQDRSRVADASGTRETVHADASGTRADAPSLPALTQHNALTQQQPETLSSETARARADAGRPAEHAGALVLGGGAQHALPAIRGKRNVDAIVQRLGQTLAEVVDGVRPPLGRDQWRRVASELVFAYWAKLYEKPGSFLSENDGRERRILSRLKENADDVGELLYALDGGKRSKFLQGDNPDRTVYDGIETLLRDRAQVEKLSGLVAAHKRGDMHPMVKKYAAVLLGLGAPDALRERLQRETSNGNGSNGNHEGEP